MDKSPDAFRTISEVADSLETPAHVLRFWESRFPQIKPVKRAGGRRYYRPADVALLGGIRHLLHDEGMTIRGVQKILREQGVRHVAGLAPGGDLTAYDALGEDDDYVLNLSVSGETPVSVTEAEPTVTGRIVALEPAPHRATPLGVPAEVVHLRSPAEVPDLSDGFMMPTANRRPLPTLDPEPVDDVPEAGHVWVEDDAPETEPPFAVEAGVRALFDEPEPEPDEVTDEVTEEVAPRASLDLVAQAVPQPMVAQTELPFDLPCVAESSEMAPELADAVAAAVPASLAGLAARLRALPRPVTPEAAAQLVELHMRLGLLHAQMVEAQRLRR